ncbi:uncharacterized protein LOC103711235 [Phoenix dactylifera]|uniref:Uncharacterized protein LOC103711235 n=1 Tax=Phoenix dactylifera TaxID=42345 RepID=A0A8B7CB28_PHODC|nr:uncharacterized protein LOC103711235 [Phoenix dactylifera]XP_008795526.1 uncharacterized protein LOC103711235 [Phoenix dactylifera]XP_008795527.1 uncharacterized protein LOC103711235 [Phoenix dactylifera]XP_026662101.1 uncharacterized protein LOC103711235 [Phoenix dactylifera]XP_038973820.1 uncharacterized protein LOC103711235 [Phoenix dactylifera]XP_038973822.1 uncharacterized protein LOC103711235 [Phoenix dactylifera]
MGDYRGKLRRGNAIEEYLHGKGVICLHAFSDLSHISPATFVYLLKECYICGTHKATRKFRVLQQQVSRALYHGPQPGPFTFIIQCLYIVSLLGPNHADGFSHMLISSLRNIRTLKSVLEDFSEAKHLVVKLFLDKFACAITDDESIVVKLLEEFDVELKDIGDAICGSELNNGCLDRAEAYAKQFISGLIESKSYMAAVKLSERFSIQHSGESFLVKMMQCNQFGTAERWATFMGKPMICLLVQKYLDMNLLKLAYDLVKGNNLMQEFPDVSHLYKESSLRKLAERGCWDVAEQRANNDRELLEFLVYLAMEAGYMEKVDELCERYNLDGFTKVVSGPGESSYGVYYLDLKKLNMDDIIWVDNIDGLLTARNYIEECKIVGIDCEWKPNYERGSRPNRVSIMQIASEVRVFIFDLIKLYEDEPEALGSCLRRILCSSNILKLGYNLQCDLNQLSYSYGNLECFDSYIMLLDIQKLFKEPKGGLSGLAKKILGAGLNKTRRNSNWEQRPLSENQKEYAALDAAVLVRIFHHVRQQPQSGANKEWCKIEWKSHIESRISRRRPTNTS